MKKLREERETAIERQTEEGKDREREIDRQR